MNAFGPWFAAALSALTLVVAANPALACLEPTAEFQLDGASVPSSVEGAMYRNCENVEPDDQPEFALVDDETDDPISISADHDRFGLYEISFDESLDDETTYRFEVDPECSRLGPDEPKSWTFETTTDAPLPGDIGAWTSTDTFLGPERHPGQNQCSKEVEAVYVSYEFNPSDDGETWGEAIAFETWVDQEIWEPQAGDGETVPAGSSRLGWGTERVFVVCTGDGPEPEPFAESLDDGLHRIEIAARLPGTDLVWASEPEHVHLECPDEDDDNGNDDNGDDDNNGDDDDSNGDDDEEEIEEVDDDAACSQISTGANGLSLMVVLFGLALLRRRRA